MKMSKNLFLQIQNDSSLTIEEKKNHAYVVKMYIECCGTGRGLYKCEYHVYKKIVGSKSGYYKHEEGETPDIHERKSTFKILNDIRHEFIDAFKTCDLDLPYVFYYEQVVKEYRELIYESKISNLNVFN